jgi:Bacterial regulatory proteins, luxR family
LGLLELTAQEAQVARLVREGLSNPEIGAWLFLSPRTLAESYAGRVDWHQVARLVQRGCPPRLALRIVY